MAVVIRGNVGKNFYNITNRQIAPGSRIEVRATAADDVALVPGHQLFKNGVLDFGTTFQLAQSGGTLKIDLTLTPVELILEDQADAAWHELSPTLANNAMIATTLIFSYIRLTFTTSGGICYIAAM